MDDDIYAILYGTERSETDLSSIPTPPMTATKARIHQRLDERPLMSSTLVAEDLEEPVPPGIIPPSKEGRRNEQAAAGGACAAGRRAGARRSRGAGAARHGQAAMPPMRLLVRGGGARDVVFAWTAPAIRPPEVSPSWKLRLTWADRTRLPSLIHSFTRFSSHWPTVRPLGGRLRPIGTAMRRSELLRLPTCRT